MSTDKEILRQTAGLVAAALGGDWRVDTSSDYWNVPIDGPDSLRIYIGRGDRSWNDSVPRIEVSVAYSHLGEHKDMPYGLEHPKITVSRDRGPEVIAREIKRRLLPAAIEETAKVVQRVQGRRDAKASRAETVGRLASVVRSYRIAESDESTKLHLDLATGYGDVRVNFAGDGADVDLRNLTIEQAEAVLRAVQE